MTNADHASRSKAESDSAEVVPGPSSTNAGAPSTNPAEIVDETAAMLDERAAARNIAQAVGARQTLAHGHLLRLRRRHPQSSPAEIIELLETQYATAITTAGMVVSIGKFAADVGIAMIPVAGAATAGAKAVGKATAKKAVSGAMKGLLRSAALAGAQRGAARLLPAGDEQLQFEITAIFGLAVAEIHGMRLDRDQAQALVFGLTNERVSTQHIASLASGLVQADDRSDSSPAATDQDHTRWASTLAAGLPGGAAQNLVRSMQTGQLEDVRASLTHHQQAAIDGGVNAISGGMAKFVFGRQVIAAEREAFPAPPDEFPDFLVVPAEADEEDDPDDDNPLATLSQTARAAGDHLADSASAVGNGIASGAAAVGGQISDAAGAILRRLPGQGHEAGAQSHESGQDEDGSFSDVRDAVGERLNGLFRRRDRERED